MNLSKLKSVYYILPICSVICILMTGLNSIHWNDDFNYLGNIDKYGFFKEATIQYFTWDGRVISPLFMIRNILLYYFPPQVLVILALCSIFYLYWQLYFRLYHMNFLKKDFLIKNLPIQI